MAKVRTDKKGRKLDKGEYQNPDGRYFYIYTDINGKQCRAYSWRLKDTDKVPKGKKCDKSLYALEAEIKSELQKGIDTTKAKKLTVDDLFDKFLEIRKLRESTETNYRYMYEKFIQPTFGKRKAKEIKKSHIAKFYKSLIDDKKLKPNTIENIHTLLRPILQVGVDDDTLVKNYSIAAYNEIRNSYKDYWDFNTVKKSSFTKDQQEAFMNYVRENQEQYDGWYNILVAFLGTGCRVSELVGLTWDDVDFNNNTISINHQVHYGKSAETGKFEKRIVPPKTKAGLRTIAMFKKVRAALLNEKERQMKQCLYSQDVISGTKWKQVTENNRKKIVEESVTLSDFIFLNRFGAVQLPHNTNRAFERIRRDYNNYEIDLANKEHREPIEMPHFSNHILRHTFITRACDEEGNIAVVSEMVGHNDISTTQNIYDEIQQERREKAVTDLESKMLIG